MRISRRGPRAAVLLGALALASLRCGGGSPTVTCQTEVCPDDAAKSYQVCAHTNNDLSYQFGGQTCTCQSSNDVQCNGCAAQVVAYCSGGGGPGGTGGGGGTTACSVTFSGAFSTTYSPCAVTITAVPAGNTWTVGTAGNALPGTPYTWTGMTFALPGSPATGPYNQSQALGASNLVEDTSATNPPEWIAGAGSGMSYGAATLTLTALGPATALSGTTLYQSPHGTWTGTLVDQNPNTSQPDVMETITF
ncbi:MAG TPA: hypothetical protein VN962_08840 [Polyangia bacterium]|nr:hypothetical protein [Polyangia bacterium]